MMEAAEAIHQQGRLGSAGILRPACRYGNKHHDDREVLHCAPPRNWDMEPQDTTRRIWSARKFRSATRCWSATGISPDLRSGNHGLFWQRSCAELRAGEQEQARN